MIKIYIDAATNQTKQISAGGMVLIEDKTQQQTHHFLASETNNEAEFEMMVIALKHCLENNWQNQTIFIYTDSRIVYASIQKKYAKEPKFNHHLEQILELMAHFNLLFIEWIDEKLNKGADNLARQALQKYY